MKQRYIFRENQQDGLAAKMDCVRICLVFKNLFSEKTNKMSALPRVPTVAEVMEGVKRAQSNIFKPVTKVCKYNLSL